MLLKFHHELITGRSSTTTITVCSTPSQGTTPRLLFTWTGTNERMNLDVVGIALTLLIH
jgi:hypothetical protein